MALARKEVTYTVAPPAQGLCAIGLEKRYGNVRAVADACFHISWGTTVAVLGQNGAGKTTMLRCVAGLLERDGGEILLDGASTKTLWRDLLLIPEYPHVYGDLTVMEHLEFVARSREIRDRPGEIAAALARFALDAHSHKLGSELSKGLRQRTLIACAALTKPRVVIFDEPFVGLDPSGQHELALLIREFVKGDRIVIVSTHLVETARALADGVIYMHMGRTKEFATFGTFGSSTEAEIFGIGRRDA